jgi:hypothetical protein
MIGFFACAKPHHCQARNCGVVADGIESNHAIVHLDLTLTSLKQADLTSLTCDTTDWCRITAEKPTKQHYNDLLLADTESNDTSYEDFNAAVKQAGEETALLVQAKCEGWF